MACRRLRRASVALACAVWLGSPPFSAAQPPPASDAAGAPPIALVLPLDSPTFGVVADAVRQGFLAAAATTSVKPLIIAHGDGDVIPAFAKAKNAGAHVIVGPLVRDDVRALAAAHLELPPTIVLNQVDEDTPRAEWMYTLSITLDSDARQLAHRARDEGASSVVIIYSDTTLQKRFASAFNAQWILAGGGPPVMYRFERSSDMLALLRRELARTPFDAAVLAVDGADATLAKSYVKSIPTFTSSQVNERRPKEALLDLDDVRFVDMPWLVDPDAPAYADVKRSTYPNAALDRLYALGIDAFRVARAFSAGGPPGKLELDGATGHLWLDETRQFVREGRMLQYRAGEIVPIGTR